MEFRSRSMRPRSSGVSSRLARSATYSTSFSLTFISRLRCAFRLVRRHELDLFDLPVQHGVERLDIARHEAGEVGPPAIVRYPHPQDSLAELQHFGPARYRFAASQLPG